ncbi:MAG TPA: 6-bladed beta-propeller [Gemmatimonadales bacterium]|nr:6-bladed beta-propeller [Gemmatimonadales bacterium]
MSRDTLPGGAVSVTSDGPTAWRDSSGWRLVETARITGGDSAAGDLANPTGAVIDPAGRLYVADQSPTEIKVFGRDGRLVRTIGRDGDGPGEFRSPILGIHGTSLVVFDPRLARISLFDTSGRFLRSWPSICCHYSAISIDRDGRIAVRMTQQDAAGFTSAFIRYAMDGTVADTIQVPNDGQPRLIELSRGGSRMRMGVPFSPNPVDALAPDGTLIHGWTGALRLAVSRTGHDTVQVFGRRWTPVPIPEAQRREVYQSLAKDLAKQWGEEAVARAFGPGDIPATAPPMRTFFVDPTGTRWVNVATADTLHATYDVFDTTGVYLGPVQGPWVGRYFPYAWTADELVVGGENADGFPELIRYRIERTLHR